MHPLIRTVVLGTLCVSLGAVQSALAQRTVGRGGPPIRDFGQSQPGAGLSVRFEAGARCTPISSPYASLTRYDGSMRQTGGAAGMHGGIDLSLDDGTPLLAIAPGRVFVAGSGGMMEGNYLWLLHLPEHTGLPFGFLSKYQHLLEQPKLEPAAPVKLGQVIARSGSTGTVGGYYGSSGYPHLHLTLRAIHDDKLPAVGKADGEFQLNRDTTIIDPLTIYIPNLKTPADGNVLANDARQLSVGYTDDNGRVFPALARFVWPVACR